MTAAYANTSAHDDDVTFTLIDGEIAPVACGAHEPRYITLQLANNSDDILSIRNYEIDVEGPFRHFAKVEKPRSFQDCGYLGNQVLQEGQYCNYVIKFNPKHIPCGNKIPTTGEYDADFTVYVNDEDYDSFSFDLDTPITLLGSGDNIALLGEDLCGTDYDSSFCTDNSSLNANGSALVPVVVEQGIVATSEFPYVSTNIQLANGQLPPTYEDDNPIAEAAASDTKAAYYNLLNLGFEGADICHTLPYDYFDTPDSSNPGFNIPRDINGGVYCMAYPSNNACSEVATVRINTAVSVESASPAIFLVDPDSCTGIPTPAPGFYAMTIGSDAIFTVDTDIGDPNVNVENLIFVVEGAVSMDTPTAITPDCDPTTTADCTYNLAGRFLVKDYFEVDAGSTPVTAPTANMIGNIYSIKGSVSLVEGNNLFQPN
jgi:hypothetical protein